MSKGPREGSGETGCGGCDTPEEIKILIGRCEINEKRFDNDDMSTVLVYADHLERQLDEALDALRELHDFAVTDYRHADRSSRAFESANEILKRYGK